MSQKFKVLFLIAFVASAVSATPLQTFQLVGSDFSISQGGGACDPMTQGHCVEGTLANFDIFSATLQELTNTPAGSTWSLDIQTNFLGSSIFSSGPNTSFFTSAAYQGLGSFNIGDFLIFSNDFQHSLGGIVLSNHLGVAPGSLILNTNDLLTSCQVLVPNSNNKCAGVQGVTRPYDDVWLANATGLFSAGTEFVFSNANPPANPPCPAGTQASFTVCDAFSAPSNFLSSGTPLFEVASFVCDNGTLSGGGSVPEPRSLFLIVPAILLAAHFARRRRRLTA